MSGYYQKVNPKDDHLYFTERMIATFRDAIKKQVVSSEVRNLAVGQGIFLLEELTMQERGKFNIAVHAEWKYDTADKQFTHFEILKYYIYSEDMPNELLDEINQLQGKGSAEWKFNT